MTHDIDDVFNDESVEAVATATRPATHAELASRCLEAGRQLVRERLRELGIGTGVHHPTPIHLQPAYAHLGPGFGAFPEAECSAARVLSLPMYPEPSDAQVDRVAEALRAATDEA